MPTQPNAGSKGSGEKILVLDRGNIELAFPRDWVVTPDPGGFMRLVDPTDECLLEVSYLRLPTLPPDAPSVEGRLRAVLAGAGPGASAAEITVVDSGKTRMAWADYPYQSDDPQRHVRRPARGRWLLAANQKFQALLTFYYWVDDAAWAVPAWERIVETLTLGDGSQLNSPADHWALREPH